MKNKKIIFLITLFLPFLYLCCYVHPYADDMFYAAYPHNVFNETNNVFLTLKAVIDQCKDIYY